MRKFHEKSIILGIGFGMIITAIAGMIYSAGTTQQPTKEEIIRLAKTYGLVEPAHIITDDAATASTDSAAPSSAATTDSTAPAETTAAASSSVTANTDQRNITIVIKEGDKSQQVIDQLLDKGIITSQKEFEKVLNAYDAATKINYGSYEFKKNEDLDYIVKTICNIK